jgi:hypothetical protein
LLKGGEGTGEKEEGNEHEIRKGRNRKIGRREGTGDKEGKEQERRKKKHDRRKRRSVTGREITD